MIKFSRFPIGGWKWDEKWFQSVRVTEPTTIMQIILCASDKLTFKWEIKIISSAHISYEETTSDGQGQ